MVTKDPDFATGKKQGLDIESIRQKFPMLSKQINGKPLVYFDSAATNHKPKIVIETLNMLYTREYAQPQKVHELSIRMTNEVENTRKKISDFINAGDEKRIVFTNSCTDGINIVAQGFGRSILNHGDEIILTELEHHANIIPWQVACELSGARILVLSVTADGEIDLDELKSLISDRTKIISISHSSHVFGTVLPVKEVIEIAHQKGIPVLIDAAQSVPHMKIDVKEMDCDYLTFSCHKMGGPAGVGVLYGKTEWLEKIPPHNVGFTNTKEVSFKLSYYKPPPYKFESGTPAFEEIVAVGSLIDFLNEIDMEKTAEYEVELLHYATDLLLKIPNIIPYGLAQQKEPILSFRVDRLDTQSAEKYLGERYNIDLRSGKLGAQPLMKKLELSGLIRASFCYYNTKQEVDLLAEGLQELVDEVL